MMKSQLRKMFWFILGMFEKGDEPYRYKPLNRKILVVVGLLFMFLSMVTFYFSRGVEGFGYLLPIVIFFCAGFVSITVGFLGSDRAVAKIWGNR